MTGIIGAFRAYGMQLLSDRVSSAIQVPSICLAVAIPRTAQSCARAHSAKLIWERATVMQPDGSAETGAAKTNTRPVINFRGILATLSFGPNEVHCAPSFACFGSVQSARRQRVAVPRLAVCERCHWETCAP